MGWPDNGSDPIWAYSSCLRPGAHHLRPAPQQEQHGDADFQGALKMYARRKDKDLRTLMRYAGMFRVEKILRQYLEVLL